MMLISMGWPKSSRARMAIRTFSPVIMKGELNHSLQAKVGFVRTASASPPRAMVSIS